MCKQSTNTNLVARVLFMTLTVLDSRAYDALYAKYIHSSCVSYNSSTHADRQGVDISVTVYGLIFCGFVCTVSDFSAEDKAGGVKFCMVVHRRTGPGISHFGDIAPPEASNRTNRSLT